MTPNSTLLEWTNDFIDFFSAIPEERWCTGTYEIDGRQCAWNFLRYKEQFNRMIPLINLIAEKNGHPTSLIGIPLLPLINDGKAKCYPQPTPKQRILAALNDVKNILEERSPRKDITGELAVLPAEEKLDSFTKQTYSINLTK